MTLTVARVPFTLDSPTSLNLKPLLNQPITTVRGHRATTHDKMSRSDGIIENGHYMRRRPRASQIRTRPYRVRDLLNTTIPQTTLRRAPEASFTASHRTAHAKKLHAAASGNLILPAATDIVWEVDEAASAADKVPLLVTLVSRHTPESESLQPLKDNKGLNYWNVCRTRLNLITQSET